MKRAITRKKLVKYVVFYNDAYGVQLDIVEAENWFAANTKAEKKFPNSVLWIEGNSTSLIATLENIAYKLRQE